MLRNSRQGNSDASKRQTHALAWLALMGLSIATIDTATSMTRVVSVSDGFGRTGDDSLRAPVLESLFVEA